MGGKRTLVCFVLVELCDGPAFLGYLRHAVGLHRRRGNQVGLPFEQMFQADHFEATTIVSVVPLTADRLPRSVLVMNEGVNRALACENVRADDAGCLGHRKNLAPFAR